MAGNFNHNVAFPQHPPDHPLWRDVNFCPPEVYQELILPLEKSNTGSTVKGVDEVAALAPPPAGEKKRGRPPKQPQLVELPPAPSPEAVVTGAWSEEEDSLLVFMQSDPGRDLRLSYDDVAECLGRSGNAVKCRWHSQVKKVIDSLSPDEYKLQVEKGQRRWYTGKQTL